MGKQQLEEISPQDLEERNMIDFISALTREHTPHLENFGGKFNLSTCAMWTYFMTNLIPSVKQLDISESSLKHVLLRQCKGSELVEIFSSLPENVQEISLIPGQFISKQNLLIWINLKVNAENNSNPKFFGGVEPKDPDLDPSAPSPQWPK